MKTLPLIEAAELLDIYNQPGVLLFDVSNGPNAQANYAAEHIAGAVFVDLNTQLADIKEDVSNGGRHPLPAIETFANTLTTLGIYKTSRVIIYDDKNGSNAAARFWWMLISAGHEQVQVLNGGLNAAKKHGVPISAGTETTVPATEPYPADIWLLPTIGINEVEQLSQSPDCLVVDVRDKDRYAGISEPIDLVAGHIPGAINIPFTENLDAEGMFLEAGELQDKYQLPFAGIAPGNIIVHCGSGVTACHTLLALAHAGMEIPILYVGSWSEWSRNGKEIAAVNR